MKIGIIQGRLSEPKEGFQECPVEWKREFDLLPKHSGIVPVSWLLDKFKSSKFWLANPGGISPVS